jgi:hypothetical protein
MNEARSKRGGGWALVVSGVRALALLLVLYVLSSAPMFGLMITAQIEPETFDTIYAPLVWIAENCKPVNAALMSNWEWWFEAFHEQR